MSILAQEIDRARQADRMLSPEQFAQRESARGEELARLLIEHVKALQSAGFTAPTPNAAADNTGFVREAEGYKVTVAASEVQVSKETAAPAEAAPVKPTDKALEKIERYNQSIAGEGAG